jgi:di/tricarboxylate transporter
MSLDAWLVVAVMAVAVTLFATEKLRVDAVALLVLGSLVVLGLLDAEQAISGFSNDATITVAAMFVLAAGLQQTGALSRIGRLFSRLRSPTMFLLALLLAIGAVSPFVNNTAVVAVFLPIVLGATAANRISASKVLIPLSYASQMGGVCTLVGTSTNLLVNSLARQMGEEGFTLFEFTGLGLICMAAGFVYLLTAGRWLLPDTRSAGLVENYDLGKYITELRVAPGSALIGTSVGEARLGEKYGVYVLELLRGNEQVWSPRAQALQEGDVLLVRGDWSKLAGFKDQVGLEIEPEFKLRAEQFEKVDQVLTEVMIAPASRFVGHTLAELDFQWHYNATVLAIHRRGEVLREKLKDVTLNIGDILLMLTPRAEMPALRANANLVVLTEKKQSDRGAHWRPPLALSIMVAVIVVSALGWLPIVISSVIGAVAMVLTGCLRADEAYESIDWRIIVLIAGVLPLGIAMSESGAAAVIAENTIGRVGGLDPIIVLGVMYLMALVLSELMSNAAAAVLLVPVAISTAHTLGLDAKPFLVAVTFAASTSFSTPVGYQTNTMVYNLGGYRFMDFVKVGVPLNLIFWILGMIFIPVFWPF